VVRKSLFSLVAALLGALLVAAPAAAAENGYVVVRPDDMHGWAFVNEGIGGTGYGRMVLGPALAPLGVGSAELAPAQTTDGWALGTSNHDGTPIRNILLLDYSTYTQGTNTSAIALQLALRNTVDPLAPLGYHRLVYEPTNNGTVIPNRWQRWNPTDPAAKWWFTPRYNAVCPQAAPCTWAHIKILFPTTSIQGGVWLKEGSAWQPGKYNVDAFLFVAAPLTGVLYDFEPERNGDSD
jgi:hypothetical protein